MMSVKTFSFSKREHIVSKKLMDSLFNGNGSHSKAAFPLRVVYQQRPRPFGEPAIQVLFSVSKRHFKHAVDRNRVKRQLREAYRLNRHLFFPEETVPAQPLADGESANGHQLLIVFIWLSDSHFPSQTVASCVRRLLKHISKTIE